MTRPAPVPDSPIAPAPAPARGLPPSAVVLIAANLVPLACVVALHWTVYSVILLYWCENVIVGAVNVLRIVAASPRNLAANVMKVMMVPFFIFHYGMFTMVHGIFVLALFGPGTMRGFPGPAAFGAAVQQAGIGFAVLVMAVSHAFSFFHNYLFSGEYLTASPAQLMAQPYARVMVLHVSILLGGFLAKAAGAPLVALLILIGLKTAIDLKAHLAERKKLGVAASL